MLLLICLHSETFIIAKILELFYSLNISLVCNKKKLSIILDFKLIRNNSLFGSEKVGYFLLAEESI
ncbi:hypothetical protein H1P_600022 [Hyella patelloides LEGE 07179]|uniref:Uncharacterized protein n=1 Tax=Hyella patelloides LEGE 07179 TaxID=945734 RepID=A0A563W174_9CYAN|nr:hypothetical protein H1P_600022 [Hyella patelloides LEGE 07179]